MRVIIQLKTEIPKPWCIQKPVFVCQNRQPFDVNRLHHFHVTFHFLLVSPVKPTLSATTTLVQVLRDNPALLAVTGQDAANPSLVKDNFVWTFEGTQQSRMDILENGNLRLTSAQPSQTGNYTCTAVNSAGSGSTTVRLEVLGEELSDCRQEQKLFESSDSEGLPCEGVIPCR